jgi:hypothetical protein
MRKPIFWLLLAGLGLCTRISAQITVTNATFPAVGDTVFYAIDANSNPIIQIFTPPGGNQNWNLSGLQANQTGSTVYRNPNTGAQSANFPGAELLVVEPGRELYYNVTADKVELMGYYGSDPIGLGINLLIPYNPPLVERRAPMNFFDINQTSSGILVPFDDSQVPANLLQLFPAQADSFRIRIAVQRIDVVDAWGNLSIPGGCYPVLREKRTQYEEKRLDAKVPPLGWLDVTDVAIQTWGLTALGVDTTTTFHYFSTVDKQEIAVVRLNNAQNAVEMVRFKHPDNSQFSISNIATSPETCPNANDGSITITATGGTGTLTYSISGPSNQTNNTGIFTGLPDGNYSITVMSSASPCTATAMAGVAAGVDAVPPTIVCPANQTLTLGANCSALLPDYTGMATASDNCGMPVVTQSPAPGTAVSGAGTMTVTLTATDANNNTAQCSFTVTKVDNTPPTITCPTTQILALGANCSATLPNYAGMVTPGDGCGVQSVTQSPAAGATVSGAGNMTVTLTVTDVNNNTAQCTFTVAKVDNTAPTIACPATQTLALGANCSAALPDYRGVATASDNCGTPMVTQSPAPGTMVSNTGNMTVTLTATDLNNNTMQCSFTVIKADNTPPAAVCINTTLIFNGQQSLPLDANELVDAADNCGVQSITISPTTIFATQVGQIVPVTVTVTDINSNVTTCTANITASGLPAGWSQQPNGIGCTNCSSEFNYSPGTGVWTGSFTGAIYSSPYTADALAFASRTLCGSGSITAQVTGINGALGWAGLMMRESNAPGAKKAQLMTNLSNFSRREFRTTTNGQAFPQQFPSNTRYWLRIVRAGNQFSLFASPNGSAWYLAGIQTIGMDNCIQMGLVATNYTANTTVTATFSDVSYTGSNVPLLGEGIGQRAESIEQPHSFEAYPNPTSGELNVALTQYVGQAVRLEVYNLTGQLLRFVEIDEVQTTVERLDLSGFSNGMYMIRVKAVGVENFQPLLPDATRRVVVAR